MGICLSTLELTLHEGVADGVFPGAVAGVSLRKASGIETVLGRAGALEPEGAPVQLDTPYDLASLTKPIVAITGLRLVQRRVLELHRPAADYLPELRDTKGGESSLALLLSHRAGLSPWGGLYKEITGPIGSPEVRAFMLREAALRVDPSPSAGGSVYSDLGYLIAGEAIAKAGGGSLSDVVAREVTRPLGIAGQVFYAAALGEGARAELIAKVAPTERCSFREQVVRGEVHDENCAAFGGVAGHAGLFGTVRGVLTFARAVLDSLEGRSGFLDRALMTWALAPRPFGGHVVGWDTRSEQGSSAGSRFSARSFGHLGFTGTSVWCDPSRSLAAVLLSNRVHPTRDNVRIRELRPRFHDAIIAGCV